VQVYKVKLSRDKGVIEVGVMFACYENVGQVIE